jgi:hypothetical protein
MNDLLSLPCLTSRQHLIRYTYKYLCLGHLQVYSVYSQYIHMDLGGTENGCYSTVMLGGPSINRSDG